jgi:hypothetical protein
MIPEAIIACPVCVNIERLKFARRGEWFISEPYNKRCCGHEKFVARHGFIKSEGVNNCRKLN